MAGGVRHRSGGWISPAGALAKLLPKLGRIPMLVHLDGMLRRSTKQSVQSPTASAPAHRVEEVGVALRRLDLVEQEFHRLELVHRIEELAQDPHLLQDLGLQQ